MLLNCLVIPYIDPPEDHVFKVKVAKSSSVNGLRELIYKRQKLDQIKDSELVLYKVSLTADEGLKEALGAHPFQGSEKLLPVDHLSKYFPSAPEERHLHILAKLPPIGVVIPAKRPLEDEKEIEYLQTSKLANLSASVIARTHYRSIQEDSKERIFDDRPAPDSGIPPIPLLYSGFGRFMDVFEGRENPLTQDFNTSKEFQLAVDDFAQKMIKFYKTECYRAKAGRDALDKIFESLPEYQKLPSLIVGEVDGQHTDGMLMGAHGATILVVEFKNEISGGGGESGAQISSYIAHSYQQALTKHDKLFVQCNVPCLGISIIGPLVVFHAIIYIGRIRIVDLTMPLTCVASAQGTTSQNALYNGFAAASILLTCIQDDVKKYMEALPIMPHIERRFPYICELPRYRRGPQDSGSINFKIQNFYANQEGRLLYTASSDEGIIIVKFMRRYSLALHEFCADLGHAPKILGFEDKILGGWCAIAMEYLALACNLSQSKDFPAQEMKLQHLVKLFHEKGLVHGDLRDPNILCSGDKVMLIDFDWGGEEGEASYPTFKLNTELTDGRENNDLKITKEDDIRVLNRTLKRIRTGLGIDPSD